MGQDTESPQNVRTIQQNTRCGKKRQNQAGAGDGTIRLLAEGGVEVQETALCKVTPTERFCSGKNQVSVVAASTGWKKFKRTPKRIEIETVAGRDEAGLNY
jgi:hypothetical protein